MFFQPTYCAICTNLKDAKDRFEEFIIKDECKNPIPPPTPEEIQKKKKVIEDDKKEKIKREELHKKRLKEIPVPIKKDTDW